MHIPLYIRTVHIPYPSCPVLLYLALCILSITHVACTSTFDFSTTTTGKMRQALAISVALLAALLQAGQLASAQNDTLQYTEKFLSSKIGYNMMHISENMKAAMSGALKHMPPKSAQQVSVSCLNSVAPHPLNWKMWCPDTHATVTHWVDHVGSTHRKIVLVPMPSMNTDMAVWFMTPMFPKTMIFNGKTFTKNQLWHPLDHKKKQEFKLAPGKSPKEPMMLMSKLDEVYRAPANSSGRHYKTELWVAAMDLANNLPHNRYVLGFDVLGFQAFTLIVEFNDSVEGLVVSVEVIIGAAVKGYDAKNPTKGVPVPMAKAVNTMLLEAVMGPYHKNGDFEGALDAVTRHVVEEFGNLPNFVPKAWGGDVRGKLAAELSAFKKNIINLVKPGTVQSTNATAATKVGLSAAHPEATASQLQAAVAVASTAAPAKRSKLQAKQQ